MTKYEYKTVRVSQKVGVLSPDLIVCESDVLSKHIALLKSGHTSGEL